MNKNTKLILVLNGLIILFFAYAAPVYAGHWSEFAGKYFCPEISNSFKCARSIESKLKSENFSRIDDKKLLVHLMDGSDITLIDGKFHFTVLELIDQINLAVIQEQYPESSRYGLLDLTNGRYLRLWGYPGFSPDNKYFIEASVAIREDGQNVFRIYYIENGKFINVYDAKAERMWGTREVSWLDFNTVQYTHVTYECEHKKISPCETKKLKLRSDGWSISSEK